MELSSAEQQRIRDEVLAQLRRLGYSAQWGLYSEYRDRSSYAIVEVHETLKIVFGKAVSDVLLHDAGLNIKEEK